MEERFETIEEVERFNRALDAWLETGEPLEEPVGFQEVFPDALRADFSPESRVRAVLRERLAGESLRTGAPRPAASQAAPERGTKMRNTSPRVLLPRVTPALAWVSAALVVLALFSSALFFANPRPVTSPAPSLTMTLLPTPSVSTSALAGVRVLTQGQTPTPAVTVWISAPRAAPAPYADGSR